MGVDIVSRTSFPVRRELAPTVRAELAPTVRAELVEALLFSRAWQSEEGRPFDRLRANGERDALRANGERDALRANGERDALRANGERDALRANGLCELGAPE